jgi:hypothetical protein
MSEERKRWLRFETSIFSRQVRTRGLGVKERPQSLQTLSIADFRQTRRTGCARFALNHWIAAKRAFQLLNERPSPAISRPKAAVPLTTRLRTRLQCRISSDSLI